MRKCLVVLCLTLLASCELFMSNEDKTKKKVNEELLGIDWNDVDNYPLFVDECDETAPKQIQKECFQSVMLASFAEALGDLQFQVKNDLNDTMYVDFEIDEHGFILVSNMEENVDILNEIKDFNTLLSERLNDLTTVKPAHKRGIPVSLRFRLPIVLKTQ